MKHLLVLIFMLVGLTGFSQIKFKFPDTRVLTDINLEDELTGVEIVSLVKHPAMEENWIAFSKQEFKIANKDKRIITAPLIICDKPIYRVDETNYEYYVVFNASTIETIVKKFFLRDNTKNTNIEHETPINGLTLIESWIVNDPQIDKSKGLGFSNITKGTWMASYFVEDESVWEEYIKTGIVSGFSIEGIMNQVLIKAKKWRSTLDSSNVKKVLYNDETLEMVIEFNNNERYTYSNMDFETASKVLFGDAVCKTTGSNEWGSWSEGKTPSLGAAVYEYLVSIDYPFTNGGNFYSSDYEQTYHKLIELLKNIE
jgi:hypothetical protein